MCRHYSWLRLHAITQWKSIFICMGLKTLISVDSKSSSSCKVMVAIIDPPRIFLTVPQDCVSVAIKRRRYSQSDKKFIQEEISKLLKEEIIEPLQSSWCAQVLITKDEQRHK